MNKGRFKATMMTARDLLAITDSDLNTELCEPLFLLSFLHLWEQSHLPLDNLLQIMALDASILVQKDARLTLEDSCQLMALAEVIAQAINLFEHTDKAATWFSEPNQALNSETPLARMATKEGRVQIKDLLYRIEFGLYS